MPTEINLSRWKLYAKVWETPISRLAADLGISDVGLRKACIRHDIPVPPRGHWARLSAGQEVTTAPLPRPSEDEVVQIIPGGRKPRAPVQPSPTASGQSDPIAVPPTLDGCHPLVEKTARFFAKAKAELERQEKRRLAPTGQPNWSRGPQLNMPRFQIGPLVNGRMSSLGEGRLHIVATLHNIDWILRFHEALIRALRAHDIRIIPRDGPGLEKVQIVGHGGTLTMAFMEDFEKRHTAGRSPIGFEYIARDSFKLQFLIPATQAPKVFRGGPSDLEAALPTIAPRVVQWLAGEAERERLRLIEEEEAKVAAAARKVEMDAWFAERALEHKRQAEARARLASRAAQAGRLMEATKAQAEYLLASEWLERLEAAAGDDAAVRAWISVARAGLTEPFGKLLNEIRQEANAVEKPPWWPDWQS